MISKKQWAFLERKTRQVFGSGFGPGFSVEKYMKPDPVQLTLDDKFILSQKRIIKPASINEQELI